MIHESTEERAALHVLGLLSGEEAERFAAELQDDHEIAALVADLRRATELLAADVPQLAPPADLKRRILSQIQGSQPVPAVRSHAREWLGWAAAAMFFFGSVALLVERGRLKGQVTALRERDTLARFEIVRLRSQLDTVPSAGAIAVWDPERQRGVLDVAQLPKPRADQDYQLWLVDPAYPDPVDGGIIRVSNTAPNRQTFAPSKPVHRLAKLAVSLERQGGVVKAQGPMVLLSE